MTMTGKPNRTEAENKEVAQRLRETARAAYDDSKNSNSDDIHITKLTRELDNYRRDNKQTLKNLTEQMESMLSKHAQLAMQHNGIVDRERKLQYEIRAIQEKINLKLQQQQDEKLRLRLADGSISDDELLQHISNLATKKFNEETIRKRQWAVPIDMIHTYIQHSICLKNIETPQKKTGEHHRYSLVRVPIQGRDYFLFFDHYFPPEVGYNFSIMDHEAILNNLKSKIQNAQVFRTYELAMARLKQVDIFKADMSEEEITKLGPEYDWSTCYDCHCVLPTEEHDADFCSLGLADFCKSTSHRGRLCHAHFQKRFDQLERDGELWFK
jgi:hypothetical protein